MESLSCNYFNSNRCRSCSLLEIAPGARRAFKERQLSEMFAGSEFSSCRIHPLISPKTIFPSRIKVKLSVTGTSQAPVIGLFDEEFNGIELLNCPLHLPQLNQILNALPAVIGKFDLAPYDIKNRRGELKGIILKASGDASDIMLRFVVRSKECLSRFEKTVPLIQEKFPAVKVVSANIQPIPHAILEGEEEIIFTETDGIWEKSGKYLLKYTPQSFSQVTYEIAEQLYAKVRELAAGLDAKQMLDLYCGVGGFSFACADVVESIVGVELSPSAISAARSSVKYNQLENLAFRCADSEDYLRTFDGPEIDLLLFNPPRRGLSPGIIKDVLKLKPKHILYSSCSAESFFRDQKQLSRVYQMKEILPFDMFPMTFHLETLALLTAIDS